MWRTIRRCMRPWKALLKKKECKWQLVELHNHRVNVAEREIQTFKNYLISGFCCMDSKWPLQLWNNLTRQSLMTLNLCCTSRKHPDRSACHSFYGKRYDCNKRPMAPPGTRAVVYEAPEGRVLWGTRDVNGWYCVPAFDHYRNMRFMCQKQKLTRPQHHTMYFHSIANSRHCLSNNIARR